MRSFFASIAVLGSLCGWLACGSAETPLDANTRQAIDSLTTAEIRVLRVELDSQCQRDRLTIVPQMVDSIKQVRLREIDAQLKTIPR
ncbi:MAG: hypothetical protein IT262_21260 [Saprospiraceae bacterium]|nr:hypothetical protein [Saprospiraceae bacterium]